MNALRRFFILCCVAVLLSSALPAQDVGRVSPERISRETASRLNFAASQHEIIGVLLDQGAYEAVPQEFDKILALGLAGEQEGLVAEAAWQTADRLREARQYAIAHSIVDRSLELAELPGNQFRLLMMRAKIFKDQKLLQQAIETFREAQRLQSPQ